MEVKKKQKKTVWTERMIQHLLEIWAQFAYKLRANRKNNQLYNEIARDLGRRDVNVTAKEVRSKVNNPTQRYRDEKKKLGTGSTPSTWRHYKDVHGIIGAYKCNAVTSEDILMPVLYSYWRSSCSWRVRIALNLKEIPYDIKPISLIKSGGEQHCNEYRDVNPMEQVPALQIDGHTLIESIAVMHYLEETRPQRPLLPQDVHKRAKVRELCEIIASGIQPLQNLIVLIHVGEEKKKEWAQHWITRGFRAIEKVLSTSAGKFCVGDEISMADCCLVPQVFNARRFHVDLRPYPIILRIDRELESHPAFRAAHPSNQPDCPPEAAK